MNTNVIYIKNMVCPRCIDVVKEISEDLKISVKDIQLGKLESNSEINDTLKAVLSKRLKERGFELLEDKNQKIITQIKALIVAQIHHSKEPLIINFSDFIADKLQHEYASLSKLFSSVEGITIEKFILKQKIEHVKELLFYKEYTLSEIAIQMNYSSVAHLSAQFKKETGMSPSQFKKIKDPKHQSLDAF
ncbi:AraC family transcriptional regulator [Polaribacter sp. Q13]|uniref:helix-turn-helix domain-containing protein n=1 Tax=Polaribacter sp. Q13 TaxID=2806551 RepID=UPI00193BF846|nr:AraC family transcriptional regulator [Polaribacter sp. Q13]QVY65892.1 helix-turn-helix transcriptional regulator [Polaribacter sp. Q13]